MARPNVTSSERMGRPYVWRYVENRRFSDVLVFSTNFARRHPTQALRSLCHEHSAWRNPCIGETGFRYLAP